MIATGIVRRVDDLGRIVIPREIRRRCGIMEGDPFEIFLENDGSVVFKKYDPGDSVERALVRLENMVLDAEGVTYREEFLQSICELKARLKLEKEDREND